jgi:hypothetical protein
MCYIDGQKNKYSVLNECNRMLKYDIFIYCFFTIYSRYLKKVISKRDGCVYRKQIPSIDGSLELI